MSGAVGSMPSLTRSGRPSASFFSSSPTGRTSTAFRVSSARPIGRPTLAALQSCGLCSVVGENRRGAGGGFASSVCSSSSLILFLLGTASFCYGSSRRSASEIPTLDPARYHRVQNSYIYASNGQILAILRGSENRKVVASDQIADVMKQAIVAVEDKRFFEHRGIDLHGILRAVWADVSGQKVVQGGSTITQQFIKNAFTGQQRSFGRKLQGGGARVAARAAVAEGPDPDRVPEHDLLRERRLRDRAGGRGVLPRARVRALAAAGGTARRHPVRPDALRPGHAPELRPRAPEPRAQRHAGPAGHHGGPVPALRSTAPLPRPQDIQLPGTQGPAPYFTNYVKQLLVDRYGTGRVFGGGLQVRTSIDLNLQQIARAGDREVAAVEQRAVRGARRDRPARRARAGHVRRAELQGEPVQPRRPGRAAARLGVQAVRARGRAQAGDLAGDARSSRSR